MVHWVISCFSHYVSQIRKTKETFQPTAVSGDGSIEVMHSVMVDCHPATGATSGVGVTPAAVG